VNNAGASYEHPMYFLELEQKEIRNLIGALFTHQAQAHTHG
jgi:hypothetical protein